MISASDWNKLQTSRRRNRIIDIRPADRLQWRHPWFVSPTYNAVQKQWVCTIKGGYVNGLCATVSLPAEAAPAVTIARLKAKAQASGQPAPMASSSVDARLNEFPYLALPNLRTIGPDSAPSSADLSSDNTDATFAFEAVPPFFRALGVGPAPTGTLTGGIQSTAPPNSRLLRATELVLYQPRIATQIQYDQGDGFGDTTVLTITATLKGSITLAQHRPYIRTAATYALPSPGDIADQLSGQYVDPGYTQTRLATVYFLSPPRAVFGSNPDASWQPYVQHWLFWNLMHGTSIPQPVPLPQNLSLITGLAGGVGDAIDQFILSGVNDANSQAALVYNQNNVQGLFWSI